MDPKALRRRNTIVEEAADSLIETGEKIELENKNRKQSFWESLKKLRTEIYDSQYREFLSRDSLSWFKLCIFYALFYGLLAGFFLLCLCAFYYTIDHKTPTYFNKESVMNFRSINPGLGFRPQVDPESELINLNLSDWKATFKYLDLFLQKYEESKNKSFIGAHGRSVIFDYQSILSNTPCAKSNFYGMNNGTPCVAVKLNRIYGWLPIYDQSKLPGNVSVSNSSDKFVFISCKGEHSADRDNIGKLEYYSSYPNNDIGGINFKYFPYRNQQNYLSPLVFVYFKEIAKNTMVNVECRAYAKNIENTDRLNRRGMVKFSIFVSK